MKMGSESTLVSAVIDTIMHARFSRPRDPRSDAYKMGVRAALNLRCQGVHIECPFSLGTAEADAFFAGTDEGHAVWRKEFEVAA